MRAGTMTCAEFFSSRCIYRLISCSCSSSPSFSSSHSSSSPSSSSAPTLTQLSDMIKETGDGVGRRWLRIAEQAREQRMIRDAALENKFRKLPNPMSPRNDKLVHNLSLKEKTKYQLQVLRHEASFNTADAKPVNMIAAVESDLCQTEETKSLIRHQVPSLLMAHRPREVLSKVKRNAFRKLKADKDLVIVPADKGRSQLYWTGKTTFKKPSIYWRTDNSMFHVQRTL
ncbi:hypothetical protein SprV_0200529500 [Sparganum proliferum]